MCLLEVIVVYITLLNVKLFTWATVSDLLRIDDLDPMYETHSKEGLYFDEFSKYSFEKRLHRIKTTKGTTPTYSEYETEEVILPNEKEKEMLRKLKNFTYHVLNNQVSSETEFVGGWDEYPLFATTTPPPDTRDNLRILDRQLCKIINNPKRYGSPAHIIYLDIFHYHVERVLKLLKRWDKSARQLAGDMGRGKGPFFLQQRLFDNDTLRSLGWTNYNLQEFYKLYGQVKNLLIEIKKEFRRQRYEVNTKEHMTSSEKKIAVIR